MITRLATLLVSIFVGMSAQAGCHLSLLLALDVSASVDDREYALQRDGVAAALLSRPVQEAIFAGNGAIALSVYEWSGRYAQRSILDWVLIDDETALKSAVYTIRSAKRVDDINPTAMGFALGHGAGLMARAPVCDRRTIDISGDGKNNDGFAPMFAYRHFPFNDVTVNGLVVRTADSGVPGFFAQEVIRGPG